MPAAAAVAPDSASALLRRQRSGEVRGAYAYDEEPTEDMQVRFGPNSRLLGERMRPNIDDELELSVALTHEAEYAFDVAGHLRLRGLLGEQQLKALNAALDGAGGAVDGMLGWAPGLREPFRELLVEETLVAALNDIVGYGYRLDRQPELFCAQTHEPGAPLRGGNEPRDPGSAYHFRNGHRYCQRVLVLWALADVPEGAGG